VICRECLREQGLPDAPGGRGWPDGIDIEEFCVRGELALEADSLEGRCARGHPYRAIREGAEGGRH
jgi:hypothetical protein